MDICPILQLSFNRCIKTAEVLARLRKYGARTIFVSIDGPRNKIETDIAEVKAVRKVVAEFEHDHVVEVRYRPINTGLRSAVESAIDWFFSNNDFGIIIEDDIFFDEKFLLYCALNRPVVEQNSIATISGNNLLGHWFPNELPQIFRLAQIFHCWGWATSKGVWAQYRKFTCHNHNHNQPVQELIHKIGTSSTLGHHLKLLWVEMAKSYFSDQSQSWAIPFMIYCIANNLRHLTPPVNLSSNTGFSENASNTITAPPYMKDIQIGENFKGALNANSAFIDAKFDALEYQYLMGASF